MGVGLIYKVTFPSGKSYVGQTTKSLEERKNKHLQKQYEKKQKTKFYRAVRKYGFDSLKWSVLYRGVPVGKLDFAEICAIYLYDSYHNGYNLTTGGEGAPGRKLTEEHKKKISVSNKGRKFTEQHKGNLSKSHLGKKFSEETKEKMSKSRQGSKHPNYKKSITFEIICKVTPDLNFNQIEVSNYLNVSIGLLQRRLKENDFENWRHFVVTLR